MERSLFHQLGFLSSLLFATLSMAQTSVNNLQEYAPISLTQYLQVVKESNALIGNKRLAKETTAAIKESLAIYQFRPSVSYFKGAYYQQVPYSPYTTPASNTYGVNVYLEGWGKRAARSEFGEAEMGRSEAEYQATEADIQTVATLSYIDALRNRLLFNSYAVAAKKIASLPQNAQTKDSSQFLKYYESAYAKDLQFTALGLLNYSGGSLSNLPLPIGKLNIPPQDFDPIQLVNQALINRADILILKAAMNSAEKNINMVKANRNWDVQPLVSYTTTPQYNSSGFTYAPQNGISAGLLIPIPVNNYLQNADIVQASNQRVGLELQIKDLKAQIEVQVMQALLQYESAKSILAQANEAFSIASKVSDQSSSKGVMAIRDKEGSLIDAQTNHVKALINVWHQTGNYSTPKI